VAETPEGLRRFEASAILSSIPINELILQLDPPAPAPVQEAARQLRYRDFLVVNLIVERDSVFPDHWLYIHDPNVQAARVQNYKNWSPAMVADPRKTSLGMEYFCNRDGELWNCKDEALIALAGREAEQLGLGQASQVIDGFVARRENAYCLHDTSYQPNLERVRGYLAGFSNLQTMGRAGMFKYNNQDHAIVTGLLAARNALGGNYDPWAVNVDAEYQEEERL
jgi:protoporphyrinogen oxidase